MKTKSYFPSAQRFGKNVLLPILVFCGLGLAVACKPAPPDAELNTFETRGVEDSLNTFKASPTESNMKNVEVALAKLDSKIKELEQDVTVMQGSDLSKAQGKLNTLNTQYHYYQDEFTNAKVKASVHKAVGSG